MPTFSAQQLHGIITRILQRAGVDAEGAAVVATELTEANLVGHDSHGIIRLGQYVEFIEAGHVKPAAQPEVVIDLPSLAVIDGRFAFGQVVAAQALDLAMRRARSVGAFTVLCRNTNHVGRLGSYTRRAALADLAALMAVNGPGAVAVTPWGGLDRRYGTNPISLAAPWGEEPIVLDMTTSMTAEGKLRVASQKGQTIPEGWVINQDGNATTDPNDFYRGGAILPLGGSLGFKGYGLGVMMDVFCGILSGAGVVRKDVPAGNNGVWLYMLDVGQVMPLDTYAQWISKFVDWLKSSRKAAGVREILLPGEMESRCRAQRIAAGIVIPDETWRQIKELADRLGVSVETV